MPPGLTTITSSFLFMSLTAMFRFARNLISGGVITKTTKNPTILEIAAGITKSINYLTLRSSDLMLSARVEPILSISANLFNRNFSQIIQSFNSVLVKNSSSYSSNSLYSLLNQGVLL